MGERAAPWPRPATRRHAWPRRPAPGTPSFACPCAGSMTSLPKHCAPSRGRRLAESWLRSIPGIREREPLARHSWYGIGGTAEFFLELESDVPLARILPRLVAEATPVFPLGLGTNTLFRGPVLPGLTIRLATETIQIAGQTVAVSAGLSMARLAGRDAQARPTPPQIGARGPRARCGS